MDLFHELSSDEFLKSETSKGVYTISYAGKKLCMSRKIKIATAVHESFYDVSPDFIDFSPNRKKYTFWTLRRVRASCPRGWGLSRHEGTPSKFVKN